MDTHRSGGKRTAKPILIELVGEEQIFINGVCAFHVGDYHCASVAVADLRQGVRAGEINVKVSDLGRFSPGDSVELRNEFRFGRANYPKVHHAVIEAIDSHSVRISPPPSNDTFWNARGSFIVRRREDRVRMRVERSDKDGVVFKGDTEACGVKLSLSDDRRGGV